MMALRLVYLLVGIYVAMLNYHHFSLEQVEVALQPLVVRTLVNLGSPPKP